MNGWYITMLVLLVTAAGLGWLSHDAGQATTSDGDYVPLFGEILAVIIAILAIACFVIGSI